MTYLIPILLFFQTIEMTFHYNSIHAYSKALQGEEILERGYFELLETSLLQGGSGVDWLYTTDSIKILPTDTDTIYLDFYGKHLDSIDVYFRFFLVPEEEFLRPVKARTMLHPINYLIYSP